MLSIKNLMKAKSANNMAAFQIPLQRAWVSFISTETIAVHTKASNKALNKASNKASNKALNKASNKALNKASNKASNQNANVI